MLQTGRGKLRMGAVLSNHDILNAEKAGRIKITPFNAERVQNNSYKLSLSETVVFAPNEFKNIWTLEKVKLPNDLVGLLTARSVWARKGLFFCASIGIDAGFSGHLVIELLNVSDSHITVPKGEPFVHLWFMETTSECTPYTGPFQGQKPGEDVIRDDSQEVLTPKT